MSLRYPVVLVHGLGVKDFRRLRAFGRIEKILKNDGHAVYTAKTDGFGSVENNAEQLNAFILQLIEQTGAEKVNVIAHSKGGLDCRHMIENLPAGGAVASLTTVCTPHKGSQIASKILRLPNPVKKLVAFFINLWYRILGDKKPDALLACKQLQSVEDGEGRLKLYPGVYCQSYSATMERPRDDFLLSLPLIFSRHFEKTDSDGLVSVESSKFGLYKGSCLDETCSHFQITGYAAKKSKREKVYAFYKKVCSELEIQGF